MYPPQEFKKPKKKTTDGVRVTIQTGFHNGGRDYESNHKESFDCTYILLQNSVSPFNFNMLSPPTPHPPRVVRDS